MKKPQFNRRGSVRFQEINHENHATVVIAGGGVVGLVLALLLKKQLNITAEVYEKAPFLANEDGAGLGLHPNGLRVLRDISPELLQGVRGAGAAYQTRKWERHDGVSHSRVIRYVVESPFCPVFLTFHSLTNIISDLHHGRGREGTLGKGQGFGAHGDSTLQVAHGTPEFCQS